MTASNEISKLNHVIRIIPADLLTPVAVYLKIANDQSYAFLLESVEGNASVARYSFVGAGPRATFRAIGDETEVSDTRGARTISQNIFDLMRSHFSNFTTAPDPDLPPFAGGAIGYIGFDCVDRFEPSLRSRSGEAELMFFDSVIAFDHVRQKIHIITSFSDDSGFMSLEEAELQNEKLEQILTSRPLEIPPPAPLSEDISTSSNFEQPHFEAAIREIKALIRAGECYQVVLSQRFERKTTAADISIYRGMRSINPSPYMFLMRMGKRSIIGSSPEMLVRCFGDKLEYRPIAGTRPRGRNTDEDQKLAREMRNDAKEVSEHMMLVDLGRNDLGRVATFGTVHVDRLMEVEKFSHVQHLVSQLSASMISGKDRFDAFAACFPAGTVSGAPKVRAIEIIRRLEKDARGVYAGAVGYFDYAGNMDTCIAIRTIVLEDGVAKIQAGAGIVADSVPEIEYQETVNKARALIKSIEIAEGRI